MMYKNITFLIIMFTLLSCYNEWIFRPEIKGVVLDKNSNKSLISIVKTLAIEGESPDSTISNNKGVFILPKKSSDGWTFLGMEKPKGPPTTNKIIISSKGFKNDTIDFTNTSSKNNKIDLGIIYLERLN